MSTESVALPEGVIAALSVAVDSHGMDAVAFAITNIALPILPFIASIMQEQHAVAMAQGLGLKDGQMDEALLLYAALLGASDQHKAFTAARAVADVLSPPALELFLAALVPPPTKGN